MPENARKYIPELFGTVTNYYVLLSVRIYVKHNPGDFKVLFIVRFFIPLHGF